MSKFREKLLHFVTDLLWVCRKMPYSRPLTHNEDIFSETKRRKWYFAIVPLWDGCCRWFIDSSEDNQLHLAKGPIRFGNWVLLAFLGGFGIWAIWAPIDSAVVTSGTVIFSAHTKTVQHLEGGIIEAIHISEGNQVQRDTPLITLEDTAIKANLNILVKQQWALEAQKERLLAERDLSEFTVDLDAMLPIQRDTYLGEIAFFKTRIKLLRGKRDILQQKLNQIKTEKSGLVAQKRAIYEQLAVLENEVKTKRALYQKGFVSQQELNDTVRQRAEIKGQFGVYVSQIAKVEQAIIEAKMEMNQFMTTHVNEVVSQLQVIGVQLTDVTEKVDATRDLLSRVIIRSPQDGTVKGLNYHTVGGVIAAGSAILEIVPRSGELVIEARVLPQDIDVVHQGNDASVRLSAYKAKKVPPLNGSVVYVSADRFVDPASGAGYYLARIKIDESELDQLTGVQLYPGMPADVFLVTGSRSFLTYLMSPITDVVGKSFREE